MRPLRLAWRNVRRNRRRAGLTVAATVFAVFLIVLHVAMNAGMHEKMVEDGVRMRSGHLVLAAADYHEHGTLESFMRFDEGRRRELRSFPGVRGFAPRILSSALLSKDTGTQAVGLMGIDPALEPTVSSLAQHVVEGEFIASGEGGKLLLGSRLAKNLDVELGDVVLLYSVAYTEEMAYELFEVAGIIRLPQVDLDRSLAILSLDDAQAFLSCGDRVAEVAVLAASADSTLTLATRLREHFSGRGGDALEVRTWPELMPELVHFMIVDDIAMVIVLGILVIVVAFGIFNTIQMSVLERVREFGVMRAMGVGGSSVFQLVFLESLIMAGLGCVLGLAIAVPTVALLEANPIRFSQEGVMGTVEFIGVEPLLVWKLTRLNLVVSVSTVLTVAIIAALYPAWKASRGRPVDALRSL